MKYLIFISIILFGCNAEKRCLKHVSKAKERGCLQSDTVTLWDTIKGFKTDTIAIFDTLNFQDTLVVVKDGVKVQTIVKWKERIIEQTVEKKDTIYKKMIVTNNLNFKPCNKWKYRIEGIVGTLSLIVFLFIWFYRRR